MIALLPSLLSFSKSDFMCASEAASYLTRHSGVKRDYTYWLGDNRRARHKKGVGVIPYIKIKSRVYYRRKNIEDVTRELYLNSLVGMPIKKLFP